MYITDEYIAAEQKYREERLRASWRPVRRRRRPARHTDR